MSAGILDGLTVSNRHTRTSGNTVYDRNGGRVNVYDANCAVNNSTISGNSTAQTGGGTYRSTVNNCTISGNSAFNESGGIYQGEVNNCIIWDVEKITDDVDGTNLSITKITVLLASTTNELATVTNDVSNLLGKIPWLVPENLIAGDKNYVLKFEVVDSSSLTNSRVFWYNKYTVVPEVGVLFLILVLITFLLKRAREI